MNQTVHNHKDHAHHHEEGHTHGGAAHHATSSACAGGCTAPIVQLGRAKTASTGHDHEDHADHDHDHGSLAPWWRVVLALLLGLAAELTHLFLGDSTTATGLGMGLAAVAIVLSGFGIYQSGMKALLRGQLNILALMAVAVTGAFLIGQWAEAAMVMALFVAAEKLEDAAMARARNAVRDLMGTMPQTVSRVLEGGRTEEVAIGAVVPDDHVRVAPGERIALDGEVLTGQSAVNQAPITGESTPVDKHPGAPLFAGSINTTGALVMRVTGVAGTTLLDRIVEMVERSQQAKAPIQRTVDRFAAIYTPIVMVMALLVAVGLPLLLDWTWMDALYRALALLVIACPCALVIATPVAIVSALGNAAKHGVLFKGGQALEKAQGIRAVAFDKTGTLTEGKPQLETWQVVATEGEVAHLDAAIGVVHALAAQSKHPVSKAIAQGLEAHAAGWDGVRSEQLAMQEIPGSGVLGDWQGQTWRLGSLHWLAKEGAAPLSPEALVQVQAWRGKGFSVTALASNETVVALFAVTDTIRAEAHQVVDMLQQQGMRTLMLSGDSPEAAQHIAARIGITQARGGLLPQDKLDAIAASSQQAPTAMIGDGINDAPALAQASLGIAIGGAEGADIAAETADVVLMGGHLQGLPGVFRLARQTHRIVWQNIILALAGKAIFLGLAVAGMATMWMAVVADLGISLLVVANGMRLRGDGATQPVVGVASDAEL